MSALLLDTHVLLWWRDDFRRINKETLAAIADPERAVFFSAVSIWEIAIKHAAGKLRMPDELLSTMEQRGFVEVPVRSAHALVAARLPRHHADPFDRMLVAQAQVEKLTLVTGDARISAYDVPVLW